MDKYPYFSDKICINATKPLIFVHFFILAQQTSLHNGEGETVSYSSPFPCFCKRIGGQNVRYFILTIIIPNLVIFVKVIFVIFDFGNEKKFYK